MGGMGEVFLARQRGPVGFEKLLVVKRILPHLSEDESFIQMFFDEARIAAALNHPNIAHIFDLGEVDGMHFIAMEYVYGESVSSVNHQANAVRGELPLGLKCRIISDAAGALDFAHRARTPNGKHLNLIHRDVSPQNILVGFNGAVKLIDFGVAKAVGKVSTTTIGSVKGKYAYMSPEQARGEVLDCRSDIFGLGIVFYELLSSTRLFKRTSQTDSMRAVIDEDVPPLSSVVKNIPKALEAIVMKALKKDRNERFQTAGEIQLAIEEFLVKQRIPATSAHLAAFMTELFPDSVSSKFVDEPTQITHPHALTTPSAKTTMPKAKTGEVSKPGTASGVKKRSPTTPSTPRTPARKAPK
jgi:serine/threonine-protein kinase